MTRELIVVQTGQCGNQLGSRLWDLSLQTHANLSRQGATDSKICFDRGMNVMFRNVDYRNGFPLEIGRPISALKARPVLVDMENGVIDSILRSPLGELFTQPQLVTDVSGSGNNWAVGYKEYGVKHGDSIMESFRIQLECCDCVDSIILLQSLSGGTGSGLGSYILEQLANEVPKINKMVVPVFPSETDNVVTAPYNSLLSLKALIDFADVVIAVDNDSLFRHDHYSIAPLHGTNTNIKNAYDPANSLVATMIDTITTSVRIGGDVVAFPSDIRRLTCVDNKFLSPALYMFKDEVPLKRSRVSLAAAFGGRYHERFRMIRSFRMDTAVSNSYFYVGNQPLGSVVKAMEGSPDSNTLFACFSKDRSEHSVLLELGDCRSFHKVLSGISDNFSRLYNRKAHLHHYLEHVEHGHLHDAQDSVERLIQTHVGRSRNVANKILSRR